MLLERLILKTDKYGLSWHDCEIIADASVLHDIGKIEIDSKILNKPGRLTPKEREEVKKHAVIGEEILLNGAGNTLNEEPMLATAVQICRWHHERYDGGGYPDGLSGECGSFNPILLECLCNISSKLIKDIYANKCD